MAMSSVLSNFPKGLYKDNNEGVVIGNKKTAQTTHRETPNLELRYTAIAPPLSVTSVSIVSPQEDRSTSVCCFTPQAVGKCALGSMYVIGVPSMMTAGHAAANVGASALGVACLSGLTCSPPLMPYVPLVTGAAVGSGLFGGGVVALSIVTCFGCGAGEKCFNGDFARSLPGLCCFVGSLSGSSVLGNFVLGVPVASLWIPAVAPCVPLAGSLCIGMLCGGGGGGGEGALEWALG